MVEVQARTELWESRRRRAAALEASHAFVGELLRLYRAMLPQQEAAYVQASESPPAPARIAAFVADTVVPGIVKAVATAGPGRLGGDISDRIAQKGAQAIVAGWMFGDEQSPPERFLARAALSPVLEALGARASPAFPGRRDRTHCPTCGGPPQLSYFSRSSDDLASGGRRLICARCHGEWGYPRMTCPSCGEASGSRLPIYGEAGTAASELGGVIRGLGPQRRSEAVFPHVRIEGCSSCRRYLLNVDLATEPAAVPLVDELAALPLDLYAREQGLTKITPNLMGF